MFDVQNWRTLPCLLVRCLLMNAGCTGNCSNKSISTIKNQKYIPYSDPPDIHKYVPVVAFSEGVG